MSYQWLLIKYFLLPWLQSIDWQSFDDAALFNNQVLPESGSTFLVLEASQASYNDLLSSAFNGAESSYPNNFMDVIWPLWKASEVELCNAIYQCMLDNGDIQALLAASSGQGSSATPDQLAVSRPAITQPLISADTCDPDSAWGQASKLVDYIHTTTEDFLQNIALIDTVSDRWEAIIDIVPVLGDAVEATLNFVTETFEALLESYQASYNDSLRDELACQFFCKVMDNCGSLSLLDMMDVLLARYNLSTQTIWEIDSITTQVALSRAALIIASVGGLAYSGDDLVFIFWLFQLSAVAAGDHAFGMNGVREYYKEMLDSVPSSGWQSECDTCDQQPRNWHFRLSDGGWVRRSGWTSGEYVIGQGWKATTGGDHPGVPPGTTLGIRMLGNNGDFAGTWRVRIELSATVAGFGMGLAGAISHNFFPGASPGIPVGQRQVFEATVTGNNNAQLLLTTNRTGSYNHAVTIHRVTLMTV